MDQLGKGSDAFFAWLAALQAAVKVKPVGLINADADLELSCSYIFSRVT